MPFPRFSASAVTSNARTCVHAHEATPAQSRGSTIPDVDADLRAQWYRKSNILHVGRQNQKQLTLFSVDCDCSLIFLLVRGR